MPFEFYNIMIKIFATMILYALIAFFISLAVSFSVIFLSRKRWNALVTDHLHNGPQRFHARPTPRLGGIGLFLALGGASLLAIMKGEPYKGSFLLLTVASLPAFLAGFAEDLKGRLSPYIRFFLIWLSGTLAFILLDARIVRLDLPIDFVFSSLIVSYFFTVFALTGLTNAINIIDGFNGLASMVALLILLSLGYVSYKVGDYFLATLSLTYASALAGFFLLNYPNGLIFLGDGGAYLTGLVVGSISVLLVFNHKEVSPWFPFLACIYPIFETLFSIYRKKFLRGISPFLPDGLHFHMLVYKRLTKWLLGPDADKTKRNSATSPFLWLLSLLGIGPALLFWNNTPLLILFSFLFGVVYLYLYWKVLMPRWIFKG